MRIADLIDQNLDKLAEAESIDNGKSLKLAKSVDIPRASSNMRFYGTAIQHFASEAHYMEGTDAMLHRAATLVNGKPLRLIKGSRRRRHLQFDVPVAGPETVRTMLATGTSALAVDAGLCTPMTRMTAPVSRFSRVSTGMCSVVL